MPIVTPLIAPAAPSTRAISGSGTFHAESERTPIGWPGPTVRRPPAVAPTARQARGLEAATPPAPSASSTFTVRVGAVVSLVPR